MKIRTLIKELQNLDPEIIVICSTEEDRGMFPIMKTGKVTILDEDGDKETRECLIL